MSQRLPYLASFLLLAGACATAPTERPPQPPSSQAVQAELGYREVLNEGAEYARLQGYKLADMYSAVELRPNYWRLRYELGVGHSGMWLTLEFDSLSRSVVREEVEVAAKPAP
jgi:hypothetical protein